MKKIVAILVAMAGIAICNFTVHAQTKWGIKAGGAFASQSSNGLGMHTYRSGIGIGIFFNSEISSSLISFQPEVLYINKGSNLVYSLGDIDINSTFLFHYIEIPLLTKLQFPVNAALTPHIFAGPAVSYLFGNVERRTEYTKTANGIDTSQVNLGVNDYTEKFDYGVSVGGGVDFKLLSQNLTLDLRYTHGLRNIIKQFESSQTNPSAKNRAWMVMLGVAF